MKATLHPGAEREIREAHQYFESRREGLGDEYLRNFYRRFMESEAGHYALFIELAETYVDKEKVRNRWKEWLSYEVQIMGELEVRGDRMH